MQQDSRIKTKLPTDHIALAVLKTMLISNVAGKAKKKNEVVCLRVMRRGKTPNNADAMAEVDSQRSLLHLVSQAGGEGKVVLADVLSIDLEGCCWLALRSDVIYDRTFARMQKI